MVLEIPYDEDDVEWFKKIDYKWNEDQLLKEISVYIDSTYNQHYAENAKIQTTEFIASNCDSPDFFRGNVIKYAARYGKKDGWNRKDIMKTIHYAVMLLADHDRKRK